jgi:hypothetical protein
MEMTPDEALQFVQRAVETENYSVRDHFEERMSLRVFFWPDVLAIIETPSSVRTGGKDEYKRPRWFLRGKTTAQAEIELLCVFEVDGSDSVIFWTIYWDD